MMGKFSWVDDHLAGRASEAQRIGQATAFSQNASRTAKPAVPIRESGERRMMSSVGQPISVGVGVSLVAMQAYPTDGTDAAFGAERPGPARAGFDKTVDALPATEITIPTTAEYHVRIGHAWDSIADWPGGGRVRLWRDHADGTTLLEEDSQAFGPGFDAMIRAGVLVRGDRLRVEVASGDGDRDGMTTVDVSLVEPPSAVIPTEKGVWGYARLNWENQVDTTISLDEVDVQPGDLLLLTAVMRRISPGICGGPTPVWMDSVGSTQMLYVDAGHSGMCRSSSWGAWWVTATPSLIANGVPFTASEAESSWDGKAEVLVMRGYSQVADFAYVGPTATDPVVMPAVTFGTHVAMLSRPSITSGGSSAQLLEGEPAIHNWGATHFLFDHDGSQSTIVRANYQVLPINLRLQ